SEVFGREPDAKLAGRAALGVLHVEEAHSPGERRPFLELSLAITAFVVGSILAVDPLPRRPVGAARWSGRRGAAADVDPARGGWTAPSGAGPARRRHHADESKQAAKSHGPIMSHRVKGSNKVES